MGLISEYDSYHISYSFLETKRLERFFEQKAGEGYLIQSLTWSNWHGNFQPVALAEMLGSISVSGQKQTAKNRKKVEKNLKKSLTIKLVCANLICELESTNFSLYILMSCMKGWMIWKGR